MNKITKSRRTALLLTQPAAALREIKPLPAISQPIDPLLRLPQVLQILPIGKSTFWKMVAEGRAPKGIKLSARTTCWRLSEIQQFVDDISNARGNV